MNLYKITFKELKPDQELFKLLIWNGNLKMKYESYFLLTKNYDLKLLKIVSKYKLLLN